MNYSKFRITLDIHKHQSQVSIPVMYGDTAVQLLVTLSDGGTPYVIGKSCWAQFVANKPDISAPLLRKCIIENGTTIRLDFDDGIADVAGVYDCEIRLYGAEGKITSPCFTMVVDPRVVADYVGDDMAANGFIDQIGTAMASFQRAEEAREEAEQGRAEAEEARVAKFGELQTDVGESYKDVNFEDRHLVFEAHDGSSKEIDLSSFAIRDEVNTALGSLTARDAELEKTDANFERRISNIEQHISDDYFVTDNTVSYKKAVPARACSTAKLLTIGGMTYKCNNLIPYPYTDTTKTVEGVTFTDNGDGTITLNGSVPEDQARGVSFTLKARSTPINLPNETCTISGCPSGSDNVYVGLSFYNDSTWTTELVDYYGVPASKNLSNISYNSVAITIGVQPGAVCNNLVIKPMLNVGSTALPYEPYYEGLRDSKVTEIVSEGVNRFDSEKITSQSSSTIEATAIDENTFTLTSKVDITQTRYLPVTVYIPIENGVSKAYIKFNAKPIGTGAITKGYMNMNILDASRNILASNLSLSGVGELSKTFGIDRYLKGDKGYLEFALFASAAEKCEAGDGVEYSNVMVSFDADVPYTPYKEPISYPIPAEIQAIEGYGKDGFVIDIEKQRSQFGDYDNPLPVPFEPFIEVEGGGSIEFVNEYEQAVPSAVKYLLKKESTV